MNAKQPPQARIAIFTDLDDTLIQTERKLPENARVSLGATDRKGEPLSFFTQAQKLMLELFAQNQATLIIPVTGRNTDALDRVEYEFTSYRAVSHGAVVLKDKSRVCEHWLKEIEPQLNDWPGLLDDCNTEINQIIQHHKLDARSRVIVDKDIPSYISVKGQIPALEIIKQHNSMHERFNHHANGRNHALLPPYASKKRAVEFIKQQMELDVNDLIIGMGDSLSDLGFMQSCQFSMIPTNSQIAKERVYA